MIVANVPAYDPMGLKSSTEMGTRHSGLCLGPKVIPQRPRLLGRSEIRGGARPGPEAFSPEPFGLPPEGSK
ncbi:hypothetical protein GUJ93_ZPchr0012g21979 [Zizania palustris]|uniref:Uncharacterized protein n=1 Tax=Zizania palustris TaxID=103762 RepID=A0A8J5WTK6_ZIZPA|nr:hypothetical protein GUJ93_ZPchr0012g21979 [Zizania palustris]